MKKYTVEQQREFLTEYQLDQWMNGSLDKHEMRAIAENGFKGYYQLKDDQIKDEFSIFVEMCEDDGMNYDEIVSLIASMLGDIE